MSFYIVGSSYVYWVYTYGSSICVFKTARDSTNCYTIIFEDAMNTSFVSQLEDTHSTTAIRQQTSHFLGRERRERLQLDHSLVNFSIIRRLLSQTVTSAG